MDISLSPVLSEEATAMMLNPAPSNVCCVLALVAICGNIPETAHCYCLHQTILVVPQNLELLPGLAIEYISCPIVAACNYESRLFSKGSLLWQRPTRLASAQSGMKVVHVKSVDDVVHNDNVCRSADSRSPSSEST